LKPYETLQLNPHEQQNAYCSYHQPETRTLKAIKSESKQQPKKRSPKIKLPIPMLQGRHCKELPKTLPRTRPSDGLEGGGGILLLGGG
jgi:hypothetical protein